MKRFNLIKDISRTTIAAFALVGSVYAVEPLSDTEMGEAVVLDPFGATAAGGQIDTTLSGREESAITSDEANQALANDPNLKNPNESIAAQYINLSQSEVEHTTTTYKDGLRIQSFGTVRDVQVDNIIDNTGADRGSRTINNINIDMNTRIHSFR